MQDDSARSLIDLAHFASGHTIFDHVDAADAVRAGDDPEAADQLEDRHLDAVDGDRNAALERNLDVRSFVGTVRRRSRQRVDLFWGLGPRVVDEAVLDSAAPQVGIYSALSLPGRRDRENLQRRIQRAYTNVEPHLIVSSAAMRDD